MIAFEFIIHKQFDDMQPLTASLNKAEIFWIWEADSDVARCDAVQSDVS
jgi:hypothetical protein